MKEPVDRILRPRQGDDELAELRKNVARVAQAIDGLPAEAALRALGFVSACTIAFAVDELSAADQAGMMDGWCLWVRKLLKMGRRDLHAWAGLVMEEDRP